MTTPEPTYPYRVGYTHGGKIRQMTIQAETREHARLQFWEHVEDMQAFTESGPEVFNLLSVEQIHTTPTHPNTMKTRYAVRITDQHNHLVGYLTHRGRTSWTYHTARRYAEEYEATHRLRATVEED